MRKLDKVIVREVRESYKPLVTGLSAAISQQVVNSLGRTPAEISESLMALEIEGERNSSSSCPLANYFTKACGFKEAFVDGSKPELTLPDGTSVRLDLPKAYDTFITRFDDGKYPYLDEDFNEYEDIDDDDDF